MKNKKRPGKKFGPKAKGSGFRPRSGSVVHIPPDVANQLAAFAFGQLIVKGLSHVMKDGGVVEVSFKECPPDGDNE